MTKYVTMLFNSLWKKKNVETPKMSQIKASRVRIAWNLYLFVTLMLCTYFQKIINDFVEFNDSYLYYFFVGIYLFNKYVFTRFVPQKEYALDLNWKLLSTHFHDTYAYITYFFIKLQKILFFVNSNIKSLHIFKFLSFKFSNSFLIWRPLFKRLSYFGNYKNSRSKFIEK